MTTVEARVAAAYRAVDRATRSTNAEPLWLPAGWLAIVLVLTAVAPTFGAPTSDGWRSRRSTPARHAVARPVRQVSWQDEQGFGAVRPAQFDQGEDALLDAFEQPFGAGSSQQPAGESTILDPDADDADRLFDDLPEEQDTGPSFSEEQATPGGDSAYEPSSADPGFDDSDLVPSLPFEQAEEDLSELLPPPSPIENEPADPLAEERAEAHEDCQEAFATLKGTGLDMIDLSIRVTGSEGEDYPFQCTLQDGEYFTPRCWNEITYTWKASGLCHKPLYFQDVHLERYGHSWGPYAQPLISGAHFFGRLAVLPYMMGLQTPDECVYTLGHYRPGDCAPYLIDPIPFTWRAAVFQAGGTMGVIGILP